MSTLVDERSVYAVKLTMKSLIGGDPLTLYLGRDYYDANEVDTGVGQIYPVIAQPYTIRREVGRYAAQQTSVVVSIYGDVNLRAYGETLQTLRKTYQLLDADVEFWLWRKPWDAATTDNSASLRMTGKVVNVDYDRLSGITTVEAVDSFGFKEQVIGRKFDEETFAGTTDLALDTRYIGLYGGYPFSDSDAGEYAIVDAPVITELHGTFGFVENVSVGTIFTGWYIDSNFVLDELKRVYVSNSAQEFIKTAWIPLNLPTDLDSVFFVTETDTWLAGSSSSYSLRDSGPIAQLDSVRNKLDSLGRVITHVALGMQYVGVPDRRPGTITIEVYHSETLPDMESIAPRGTRLAVATLDNTDAVIGGSKSIILVPLQPWITSANDGFLTDYSNLIFTCSWSNSDSTPDILVFKDPETNFTHYERGSAEERAFEKIDDERISFEALFLTSDSSNFATISSALYTSYQMRTILGYGGERAQALGPEFQALQWKVQMSGLKDVAGTITTSAGMQVTRPYDIVALVYQSLLRESPIAIEKGNTNFILGDDFNMTFTLEDYDAKTFLLDVCRHSRMVIYPDRDGTITLHAPAYTFPEAIVTEFWGSFHGDDLYIVNVFDNDETQIVNAIKSDYDPDFLDINTDPAVIRTAQGAQTKKEIIINADETTDILDTTRQAQAAASEAKYGRRETTESFPLYRGLSKALGIANYIFDRYHELQQRIVFEVPTFVENRIFNYYENIRIGAKEIPDDEPTFDELRVHEEYGSVIAYDEGIRAFLVNYGTIEGQIVAFEESESFVTGLRIELETVSEFTS